ncbi:MAG: DUF4186 domain-containing protein [Acidobacteria bacterium]|nr:DUF4186 domain-containing protein [Acidobacteriota bacterium]
MRDVDEVLAALQKSDFRRRQKLTEKDLGYLRNKGTETVREHTLRFITERLAPAKPANDGKQTPWRGHPTFTAQHATATCCRGRLAKWHHIEKGRELTRPEIEYVVDVISRWLDLST